jgi:hypothetical protein
MNTAPSSRNQDTIQKMLSYSMEQSFASILQKINLQPAEKAIDLDLARNLAHILFTISGLKFKALVLLHHPTGINALHYLNILTNDDRNTKTEKDIAPYYTEIGNQFCGEVKRQFYKQFEHLGMSTPSILSPATTIAHIASETLDVECHRFYTDKEQIVVGCSMYIFSDQTIEFEFDQSSGNETISSGELEFF